MMANIVYKGGTGITVITNADLESAAGGDETAFPCLGASDAPQQTNYTDIRDAITANPGGEIGSGTAATGLNVSGDADLDGAVVINESGAADKDFRAESENNTHMLFMDASRDALGINNDSPADDLEIDITGRLRVSDAAFYDEFWTGAAGEWATRVTTGSVAAQSKGNGWIRLTTGATNTNEESLDWDDVCPFVNTKRPTFECRFQLEQVTDVEFLAGFIEASGGADDDYILLSFDAYTQNTVYLDVSSGGTNTTEMGAVLTTDETELRFVYTSDTSLEWFVNGVSQGTVSTNVPTVQLQPIIGIKTQENVAHYIEFDYVKIWQDRT